MQTEVVLMGPHRTHDLSKKKCFGEKRYTAERENKRTRVTAWPVMTVAMVIVIQTRFVYASMLEGRCTHL